jgi:hypothetical protein
MMWAIALRRVLGAVVIAEIQRSTSSGLRSRWVMRLLVTTLNTLQL